MAAHEIDHAADMPFTSFVLGAGRTPDAADPDAAAVQRLGYEAFILAQELAVARGYEAGRIAESDYHAFRETSAQAVEALAAALQQERGGLEADAVGLFEGLATEAAAAAVDELHEAQRTHPDGLTARIEAGDAALEAREIPLHVAADYAAFESSAMHVVAGVLDGMDGITAARLERMADAAIEHMGGLAASLLGARADMAGTDPIEIEAAREALDALHAGVPAEREAIRQEINAIVAAIDADAAGMADAAAARAEDIAVAREHAELVPDATVEHWPFRTIEDPALIETIEQDTGDVVAMAEPDDAPYSVAWDVAVLGAEGSTVLELAEAEPAEDAGDDAAGPGAEALT